MKTLIRTSDGPEGSLPADQFEAFQSELQAAAAAWFARRGYTVREDSAYCLREPFLWHHNIILPEVVRLVHHTCQTWKPRHPGLPGCLRDDLHHGLSSQGMGFNLLGPLVARNDLAPLKEAFTAVGGRWCMSTPNTHFAYYNRRVLGERDGMPTCLDFALTNRKTGLFMDIKLAETGFAGCPFHRDGTCDGRNPCTAGRVAECPLTRSGSTTWRLMESFGLAEAALVDGDTCPLVRYDPFFKHLLFALASDGVLVLLHDARNPVFVQRDTHGSLVGGLCKRLSETLPRLVWSHVAALTVQDVVRAIEASGRHNDWIGQFKEKYAIN
jgi:POLQ-like helicase